MLTLIDNPQPGSETDFNRELTGTQYLVENCFGLFSSKLRAVNKETPMRYSLEKASKIIKASAIIHNFILLNE